MNYLFQNNQGRELGQVLAPEKKEEPVVQKPVADSFYTQRLQYPTEPL